MLKFTRYNISTSILLLLLLPIYTFCLNNNNTNYFTNSNENKCLLVHYKINNDSLIAKNKINKYNFCKYGSNLLLYQIDQNSQIGLHISHFLFKPRIGIFISIKFSFNNLHSFSRFRYTPTDGDQIISKQKKVFRTMIGFITPPISNKFNLYAGIGNMTREWIYKCDLYNNPNWYHSTEWTHTDKKASCLYYEIGCIIRLNKRLNSSLGLWWGNANDYGISYGIGFSFYKYRLSKHNIKIIEDE